MVRPSGLHRGMKSRWSPVVNGLGRPPWVGASHRLVYFFSVLRSTRSTT